MIEICCFPPSFQGQSRVRLEKTTSLLCGAEAGQQVLISFEKVGFLGVFSEDVIDNIPYISEHLMDKCQEFLRY